MSVLEKILNNSINKLKPVYLIYGEENYILNDFKERFIAKFITHKVSDFDYTFIGGTENFAATLKNKANTPPFMGKKRYIIARTGDFFLMKQEGDTLLINLFNNFPETTILFILVEGRIKKNLKVVRELKKIGEILEITAPRFADLDNWIINEFSKRGKVVDKQGIRLLEQTFSNNLHMLESEIEKISLYIKDSQKIELDDIKVIISKDRVVEDNLIFSLTEALVSDKTDEAILILNELLQNGGIPLKILGTIVWQIKLLLSVKELKKKGRSIHDISSRLKVHQYPIKKSYGKTDNFTEEELEIMLERFLEANFNIVSGKYQPVMALEKAIIGK